MKDKNKNGIDDDFEKKLARDLVIIQVSGIIAFLILVAIIALLHGT